MTEILLLNGSPRRGGNVSRLIDEAAAGVVQEGGTPRVIEVSDLELAYCEGCGECERGAVCAIDDGFRTLHDAMISADGFIIGSPVYGWFMPAQLKTVLERSRSLLRTGRLRGKLGATLVVSARRGNMNVANAFTEFFRNAGVMSMESVFGFAGFPKGEIQHDTFARRQAFETGTYMVRLARRGDAMSLAAILGELPAVLTSGALRKTGGLWPDVPGPHEAREEND